MADSDLNPEQANLLSWLSRREAAALESLIWDLLECLGRVGEGDVGALDAEAEDVDSVHPVAQTSAWELENWVVVDRIGVNETGRIGLCCH